MSFLRHREIYRSDGLGFRESGARSGGLHAPTHRFDEFPAGYSLAGCAPAEPASASPAEQKFTMKAIPRPSFFQRMGKPCLAGCLTSGVHRGSLFCLRWAWWAPRIRKSRTYLKGLNSMGRFWCSMA